MYTALSNVVYNLPKANQENLVLLNINEIGQSFGLLNDITISDTPSKIQEIEELLRHWGLHEELAEIFNSIISLLLGGLICKKNIFLEHKVDADVIAHISESDINELIPLIGLRTKFKKNLIEWRIQNVKTFYYFLFLFKNVLCI